LSCSAAASLSAVVPEVGGAAVMGRTTAIPSFRQEGMGHRASVQRLWSVIHSIHLQPSDICCCSLEAALSLRWPKLPALFLSSSGSTEELRHRSRMSHLKCRNSPVPRGLKHVRDTRCTKEETPPERLSGPVGLSFCSAPPAPLHTSRCGNRGSRGEETLPVSPIMSADSRAGFTPRPVQDQSWGLSRPQAIWLSAGSVAFNSWPRHLFLCLCVGWSHAAHGG
jgi:hypothetical protein